MNTIRQFIRHYIRKIAKQLDYLTHSKVTPNMITLTGLGAHFFIAYFIAVNWWLLAGILLIIFGLFDTLDGELARIQKKASPGGMLLDAVTDRFKETMIYTGVGFSLATSEQPYFAVLAIFACGASLCVSYVKAKGESALITSKKDIPHARLNRIFSSGVASFEVRIAILIVCLLIGQIVAGLVILIVITTFTAVSRLLSISRELNKYG